MHKIAYPILVFLIIVLLLGYTIVLNDDLGNKFDTVVYSETPFIYQKDNVRWYSCYIKSDAPVDVGIYKNNVEMTVYQNITYQKYTHYTLDSGTYTIIMNKNNATNIQHTTVSFEETYYTLLTFALLCIFILVTSIIIITSLITCLSFIIIFASGYLRVRKYEHNIYTNDFL